MDKKYNKFMSEALIEAKKAFDKNEVPVGAVIVKDDKIIGRGHNLRETTNNPINHAEIIAIQNASETLNTWKLKGCTIYVTVEPCIMCAGAIMQARMDCVVYGVSEPKTGCIDSVINLYEQQGFNHYPIHISGVMEKECQRFMIDFFKTKR